MEHDLAEATVAIVGLGLMGGSLAAALSTAKACRRIVGVARRHSTLSMAQDLRFIQAGTSDVQQGVAEADIVILATPVRDVLDKIATLGPSLKPGVVLMDVGSTKSEVCRAMAALPAHVQPLGGHPMCGKETSGLAMADPGLYRERVFVLCPLERTSPGALALATALVRAVGGRPLQIDPQRHDRLVAAISHLPYLLAVTLLNAAADMAGEDALAWRLAAGGFRDTSRVGGGDVTMMLDILATNRGPILDAVRLAREELGALERSLQDGDFEGLQRLLEAARRRRLEVFPNPGA
jgi:prephenate dehydrogenase